MDWLTAKLDIRREEWPLLRLLLGLAFARSLAVFFLEVTAGALFLQATGSEDLAYVFMASAVVLVAIGYGVQRLEYRRTRFGFLTPNRLIRLNLLLLAAGIAVFYTLAVRVDAVWVYILLMVWQVVHAILIELEVANVTGALVDLRQSKRFGGPLAMAGVTAAVLGGLCIGPLLALLGDLAQLLILALLATLGCWLLVARLQRLAARSLGGAAREEADTARASPSLLGTVLRSKDNYLRYFFAVSVLAAVSIVLVDFLFYRQLDRILGDRPEELATLLGFYFAVVGIANLLATLQLVPRFLNAADLTQRLGWLPQPVAAGMLLALLGALLALGMQLTGVDLPRGLDLAVLGAVLLAGLCQDVLQDAFYDPLFRTLYKPLPLAQQRPARWLREAVVEPLAVGVAGLLLLILTRGLTALDAPPYTTFAVVAILLLVVLYGWYQLSDDLGRAYQALLQGLLSRRWLPGEGKLQVDAATVQRLVANCHTDDADNHATVLFALRALESMDYGDLTHCLLAVLDHPQPMVRRYALELLHRHAPAEALEPLLQRLHAETDPTLHGLCIRVLCRTAGAEADDPVGVFLDDPEELVQRGALVGLLCHGGLHGVHGATSRMRLLLRSANPTERRLAATVLGEAGLTGYYRPLIGLLQDPDHAVRQAALEAATTLVHPRLVPPLLEQFSNPTVHSAAARALAAHGEYALPLLADALEEPQSRQRRLRLIGVLGRIDDEAVAPLLLGQLRYPDALVRFRVLEALNRRHHRVGGDDIDEVQQQLRDEASQMIHGLRALEDLENGPRTAPLSPLGWPGWPSNGYQVDLGKALVGDLRQARQRLLLLLGLLDNSQGFASAAAKLDTTDREQRGKALEIIDNAIPGTQRALVLPLIEYTTGELIHPATRRGLLSGLRERFRSDTLATTLHALNHRSRLSALANRPTRYSSLWSRLCALAVLAYQHGSGVQGELLGPARNPGPTVLRETALGLLFRHDPDTAARVLKPLRHDPDPRISALVTTLIDGSDHIMLMELEKAIILSSVQLFSQVPQEQLLELATIAREREVRKGEVVIRKGAQETTMFVVAEGSLKVDIPGVPPLYRGGVVGEMATLANQPRTATVRAEEDSLLLVLDRAPLFELMAEHMSVVEGVIKMLCERVNK